MPPPDAPEFSAIACQAMGTYFYCAANHIGIPLNTSLRILAEYCSFFAIYLRTSGSLESIAALEITPFETLGKSPGGAFPRASGYHRAAADLITSFIESCKNSIVFHDLTT